MSNTTHENLQISPELLGLSDIKILEVTPKLSQREIIIRVERKCNAIGFNKIL